MSSKRKVLLTLLGMFITVAVALAALMTDWYPISMLIPIGMGAVIGVIVRFFFSRQEQKLLNTALEDIVKWFVLIVGALFTKLFPRWN